MEVTVTTQVPCKLIVVAGSSSYVTHLEEEYGCRRPEIVTTCANPNADGNRYIQINRDTFEKLLSQNHLLWQTTYEGELYGVKKKRVKNLVAKHLVVMGVNVALFPTVYQATEWLGLSQSEVRLVRVKDSSRRHSVINRYAQLPIYEVTVMEDQKSLHQQLKEVYYGLTCP